MHRNFSSPEKSTTGRLSEPRTHQLYALRLLTTVLLLSASPAVLAAPAAVSDAQETPPFVAPDSLSPEMQRWVWRAVGSRGSAAQRTRRLTNAVFSIHGLNLREIVSPTLSAQEVFRTRRANCVSLAHLLVALGREIGLPLDYAISGDQSEPKRDRGASVSYGHLVVVVRSERPVVIDFAGLTSQGLEVVRPISDAEANAIYYSNLGAEALLRQRLQEGRRWLELATRLGPRIPATWLNLGVALRRTGKTAEARDAYERALALNSEYRFAARNLEILAGSDL